MNAALPAFDGAIRNPNDPGHLMVIKPVPRRIRVLAGGTLLADSRTALRVLEIGKSVYDPVFYLPEADCLGSLTPLDRTTFCPIKGTAGYLAFEDREIGWVYREPVPASRLLRDHVAFWPEKTAVTEGD